MKGDIEITRVIEERRDSPCQVSRIVEPVSLEELDAIRNSGGLDEMKSLNVTQKTGVRGPSHHPDPDRTIKRFTYEKDPVPDLPLPVTNAGASKPSVESQVDGKRVPVLGTMQENAAHQKEKSDYSGQADSTPNGNVPTLPLPNTLNRKEV